MPPSTGNFILSIVCEYDLYGSHKALLQPYAVSAFSAAAMEALMCRITALDTYNRIFNYVNAGGAGHVRARSAAIFVWITDAFEL